MPPEPASKSCPGVANALCTSKPCASPLLTLARVDMAGWGALTRWIVPDHGESAWRAGADGYAVVRLPSGTQRRVLASCSATVGALSNPQHKNRKAGKAGASRWQGRRPVVRACPLS